MLDINNSVDTECSLFDKWNCIAPMKMLNDCRSYITELKFPLHGMYCQFLNVETFHLKSLRSSLDDG